jgi:hypothetical protein
MGQAHFARLFLAKSGLLKQIAERPHARLENAGFCDGTKRLSWELWAFQWQIGQSWT